MPRLTPLEPPYALEVQNTLRRLMGPVEAEPLVLFRTIAHHGALLERFRQLGSTLLAHGCLPADEREVVIHRATARCGAAYEWGVHATAFAGPLGLGEDWLAATWSGEPGDPALPPRHALLVRVVDELHDTGALGEATWAELRAAYADDELVEIVCLAGFYHLVGFLCGAFALPAEPWAAAPPTR